MTISVTLHELTSSPRTSNIAGVMLKLPTTQRAYSLRLSRAPGVCEACKRSEGCDCWRDALWATHEAVNRGVQVFGDWLLTLRGGLCHTLAGPEVPAKGKQPARMLNDVERRDRRILLALSWLSVEDEKGAPMGSGLRVATGRDSSNQRGEAVETALREILRQRGVQEKDIKVWVDHCKPSLGASIREDAVWVNRSACFDKAVACGGDMPTRDEVWDFLEQFFGTREEYFAGIGDGENEDDTAGEPARQDERAKDLVQKAGQWLSARFGTGKGSDFDSLAAAYKKIAEWASQAQAGDSGAATVEGIAGFLDLHSESRDLDAVLKCISRPGPKSATRNHLKSLAAKSIVARDDLNRLKDLAEKDAAKCKDNAGRKGHRPWADKVLNDAAKACGFTYLQNDGPARHREFSVMLDHAARRVSIVHSWIKRAEQRRREFEKDSIKLEPLRRRALRGVEWLEQFCAERSTATGARADSGHRIRKRAVEGWTELFEAWSSQSCDSEEMRIAAARELQAEPEIKKFGDIQLFEALATDDAICVWHDQSGNPDASILTTYVSATTAVHNQKRLKVPSYCHPDPLRHPVFCDFGNSRWSIQFDVHNAVNPRSKGKGAKKDTSGPQNRHGLRMRLWNGGSVGDVDLHWSSKRLTADLALDDNRDAKAPKVTRADRLGRAASGAVPQAAVMNVFGEKHWNGRLQAPRVQLDRIARLESDARHAQAETLRRRLRWFVTFSPRLCPSGPFIEWAASQGLLTSEKEIQIAPRNEKDARRGLAYPFSHPANGDGRQGISKHLLSRLPGIRLLSVDLGHRFAAACAVWEALTSKALQEEIHGLKVISGGAGHVDLHLQVERAGTGGKAHNVVYRRIGPDRLPDHTAHPAPWARLDRQFLIKLQGEEGPARWASRRETDKVRGWEEALGRVRHDAQDALPHRIAALMSDAVATLRRALRRHGDRARIAFNLIATERYLPGGALEKLDQAGRVELLTRTLVLWHGLFNGNRWADQWAADEWERHGLPNLAIPEEVDASPAARRGLRKRLENALKPHAERLAGTNLTDVSRSWSDRWRKDDAEWAGWLKELKRWIAPRGLRPLSTDSAATLERKKAARAAARHVGGLSITRINTISGLYQILKAFKMRPEPDNLRKNIPQKGDNKLDKFNRRLLDVRDRLREQRVKQLASRIIEAALGVGRINIPKKGKAPERPRRAVDAPCHAVVIESLSSYRPDDLRTRRENRQLMQWSSAKVQKYLKEGCQLYGLHLREVLAAYTSRQCSRTGLPGIRCDDVPVKEFMDASWWSKEIGAARKRLKRNGTDAEDQFLVELSDRLKQLHAEKKLLPPVVRVPRQGGDLFVAAPPWSLLHSQAGVCLDRASKRAIQADLNAAANIGLRAVLDPDWPGRWWYVPCKRGTSEPVSEKTKGCIAFESVQRLPIMTDEEHRSNASRPIENLWRDLTADGLANGSWSSTPEYWTDVTRRVVHLLRCYNGLPVTGQNPCE